MIPTEQLVKTIYRHHFKISPPESQPCVSRKVMEAAIYRHLLNNRPGMIALAQRTVVEDRNLRRYITRSGPHVFSPEDRALLLAHLHTVESHGICCVS